jgi:uncharacterized protein YydD (DUF2326 family)
MQINPVAVSNKKDKTMADESEQTAYLKNMARDIQTLKNNLLEVINYMHEAESEVPEKMRRFVMYFHDLHDIKYIYEEAGHVVPAYILREMERCDDRFRQLVEEANKPGGSFEKVRREMTKHEGNRWDHAAMLPKGNSDETRTINEQDGRDEDRAA